MPRKSPSDRGFALVGVVIVLAVLVALSLAYTSLVRSSARTQAILRQQSEAQSVADGLVRAFAFALARASAGETEAPAFPLEGTTFTCRHANDSAAITVVETTGLIDLNQAPVQQLERLLRGLGLDLLAALRIAGDIIDDRDADDDRTVGEGQESAAPKARGAVRTFRNRSFSSVTDLHGLDGLPPETIDRLRPFVTVHSHQHEIDPRRAPVGLLEVLRRADGDLAPVAADDLRSGYRPLLDFDGGGGPRAFAIEVAIATTLGPRAWRQAVIEVIDDTPGTFHVREWTQRITGAGDVAQASDAGECLAYVR